MTKEETLYMHRELWNWLAENPDREKFQWPRWRGRAPVVNHCFLCDYASQEDETGRPHCCCLLDWENSRRCYDVDSYYSLYDDTEDLVIRAQLARKIANLKEVSDE